MPLKSQAQQAPLLYLITSGETTVQTTPATEDFSNLLQLIQCAVIAGIDLIQIREKSLATSVLYELSARAAGITKGTATRLLINDRPDVAAAAGADGVHLATSSLPTNVLRQAFGDEFLIGVSTHSFEEASTASRSGADFAVFGPVFDTGSKSKYGDPMGLTNLALVSSQLSPFPILALGGITIDKVTDCIQAGASGVAAIRMFNDPDRLADIVHETRQRS